MSTRITAREPPARPSCPRRARSGRQACRPTGATRSSSSVRPTWPSLAAARASSGAKPRPSSVTTSRAWRGSGRVTSTRTFGLGVGAARCAAPRGRRGRPARRGPSRARAPSSTCSSVAIPSACSGLSRSLSAGSSPADSRRGGWISTSSVRRSRTPWRSVGRPRRAARRASRVSPRRRGVVGQRGEPERDAGEVLDDAVVQVGGDPPALLVGGLDGAREQALAIAVAALQAPRHRPGERDLEEQQHEQAGEQRRRERAQQAARRSRCTELNAGRSRRGPGCRRACGSACGPRAACPPGARSGSRAWSGR